MLTLVRDLEPSRTRTSTPRREDSRLRDLSAVRDSPRMERAPASRLVPPDLSAVPPPRVFVLSLLLFSTCPRGAEF
jgi:hypothetical protein